MTNGELLLLGGGVALVGAGVWWWKRRTPTTVTVQGDTGVASADMVGGLPAPPNVPQEAVRSGGARGTRGGAVSASMAGTRPDIVARRIAGAQIAARDRGGSEALAAAGRALAVAAAFDTALTGSSQTYRAAKEAVAVEAARAKADVATAQAQAASFVASADNAGARVIKGLIR